MGRSEEKKVRLEQELSNAGKRLKDQSVELHKAANRYHKAEQDVLEKKAERRDADANDKGLKDRIKASKVDEQQLKDACSDLRVKNLELSERQEKAARDAKEATLKHDRLSKDLDRESKEKETALSQRAQDKVRMKQAATDLKNAKDKLDQEEERSTRQGRDIRKLEGTVAAKRSEAHEYGEKLRKSYNDRQSLEDEKTALIQKRKSLETDRLNLEQKNKKIEKDLRDARDAEEELRSKCKNVEAERRAAVRQMTEEAERQHKAARAAEHEVRELKWHLNIVGYQRSKLMFGSTAVLAAGTILAAQWCWRQLAAGALVKVPSLCELW